MAHVSHSPSAKKRHRQSLRRGERNQARRSAARTAVRTAREAIATGDQAAAETAVRTATAVLDRTAQKGVIHDNNAARRKSRLMHQLNAMGAADATPAPPKRRTAKKASAAKSSRAKKS